MKKYKYILVVLVYRNGEDLNAFFESVRKHIIDSFRIIVINSFFDNQSNKYIEDISKKNDCDFLKVDNKGYGAGNNRGIEFANQNYEYEFLIISNPDIEIKKFRHTILDNFNNSVIGPVILTKSNKNQNPYWYCDNHLTEYLMYKGFKKRHKNLIYLGIILNKIIREAFLLIFKASKMRYNRVFALHGSFVIFTSNVLKKIRLPYDEDMFLFAEEAYLAHLLSMNNLHSYITKDIEVYHKEDGSIKYSKINEGEEARKSVITYYEKLNANIY